MPSANHTADTPDRAAAAYNFAEIEPRWQRLWREQNAFAAKPPSAAPEKAYILDMFPYPSGAGLHLGHCENYAITDILARFHRANGKNVLYPIGWDAFGLPTENHAVKTGRHPADVTRENVSNFKRQLSALGVSYDFSREINTTDPRYFRWTQWIFLQLFRKNLAYVEEKPVWWCPALGTVLANEEVVDGKSEVGKHPVERRPLRQWVLRITAYADRLLDGLKALDWPDSTKRMQEAWIGRSEGSEVEFDIAQHPEKIRVFTTRIDTLHGATYMVLAPEHPLVPKITTPAQQAAVNAYIKAAASKSDLERAELAKDKTGVFTGAFALNPVNNREIPVWIADYVLSSYGTGAIMAVPAHDERDFAFAQKYQLPVIQVIAPNDNTPVTLPFTDKSPDVRLINSADLDALAPAAAKKILDARFAAENRGHAATQYKLRDWLFSRQRYWGEPFPVVWVSETDYQAAATAAADKLPLPKTPVTATLGGQLRYALPLPESALPLTLPDVQTYQPTGTGESPLAAMTGWLEIWHEPATGKSVPASQPQPAPHWIRARRETNTMPQWAGSCWYYLRYTDPRNDTAIASPEALRYWGAPDLYVGGAEHAVLHLLYARFWHKVLFDIGAVPSDEPFPRLFHQGIILGEDGEKMSKSRGNVANPDDIIRSHGADTLRLYLMFLGPLEAMKPWNPQGIEGVHRFLQKIWREIVSPENTLNPKLTSATPPERGNLSPVSPAATCPPAEAALQKLLHATIKKVTDDITHLRYNTAISQMMIFVNAWQKAPAVPLATAKTFLQLLAPFAPHIAEELWARLGETASIMTAPWPAHDPALLADDTQKIVLQINGKRRAELLLPAGADQQAAVAAAQSSPAAAPHLAGKSIRKIIYVPARILNLVVS